MLTKKPKTFKECYRLDETSLSLRKWSESLYNRGNLLFNIHLGIGIVGFFVFLIAATQFKYDSLDAILFGVGIGFFLLCLIVGLIVRAIMRTLSVLVSAKAHIVHNTRVSANIALYEASKKYSELDDEDQSKKSKSKNEKFDDVDYNDDDYKSDDEDSLPQVVCPNCGTKHDFDYPKCPNCKHKY